MSVANDSGHGTARNYRYLAYALILSSLLLRIYNLNSPLVEHHGFRQTQTAMTVWSYLHDGISMLHYKTPIYGPPWQVPFEFPLYQALCALVIKATGLPLDLGCRITSLICFYISALLLWRLCRHYLGSGVSMAVLLTYLWMPHTIMWSRACLMEYAAVSFGLGYILSAISWVSKPNRLGWLVLAVICGVFCALVKITTLIAFLPVILGVVAQPFLSKKTRADNNTAPGFWYYLSVSLLFLIPLVLALLWTRHADAIKAADPTTAMMTSARLTKWNFGTLAQRVSLSAWKAVLTKLIILMLPVGYAAFLIPSIRKKAAESVYTKMLLLSAFAGIALPILTFFNLYVIHSYYLCSVSPWAALLAGYGIYSMMITIFSDRSRLNRASSILVMTILIITYMSGWYYIRPMWKISYKDCKICQIGRIVQRMTGPDACVVVASPDYDPSWVYYTQRKGMILADASQLSLPFLHTSQFETLVCCGHQSNVEKSFPDRKLSYKKGDIAIYRINGGL